MPARLKGWLRPLFYRLLFHVIAGLIVGVSGNVFVAFTFKATEDDRFSLTHLYAYATNVADMFGDGSRLWVSLNALALYAVLMATVGYFLKHRVVEPLFRKSGIDNPLLNWRDLLARMHYRVLYWLASSLDRMVTLWAVYITYVAHDPEMGISWFRFVRYVGSPIRLLLNPDTTIGFVVFLFSTSVLVSVFSLLTRRRFTDLGLRAGVLEKNGLGSFRFRFVYYTINAMLVGISGNTFVHFTFKGEASERFLLNHLEQYGIEVLTMFGDTTRLVVSVSALVIYALVMSSFGHAMKHRVIEPLFRTVGIDDSTLALSVHVRRLPLRTVYWVMSTVDRLVSAWVLYITYLAHDPEKPISWLKFSQSVKSPIRILSNHDSQIGFVVFLLATSILASVFTLLTRRHHRDIGIMGNVKL